MMMGTDINMTELNRRRWPLIEKIIVLSAVCRLMLVWLVDARICDSLRGESISCWIVVLFMNWHCKRHD